MNSSAPPAPVSVPAPPAPPAPPTNSSDNGMMIFIIILVVLVILGVGGYFVYQKFFSPSAKCPKQDSDKKIVDVLKEVLAFNKKNPMAALEDETIEKSIEARGEVRGNAYQGLALTEQEAEYIFPLVRGTRSADRE